MPHSQTPVASWTLTLALLALAGNPQLTGIVGDLRNRSRLYGLDSLVHHHGRGIWTGQYARLE